MNVETCWVCEGNVVHTKRDSNGGETISCKRCGTFSMSGSLVTTTSDLTSDQKRRLSSWIRQRFVGSRQVNLDTQSLSAVLSQLPDPKQTQKYDHLLLSLAKIYPTPGTSIGYEKQSDYPLSYAENPEEGGFHFSTLGQLGYLGGSGNNVKITPTGWKRIEELEETPSASKFAFIAMKFNDEMLALWKKSFGAAVQKAGYTPLISGDPPHNDRIDSRIMSDIKKSRFIVADVTHANQGVYFEAGYALGLGRPVIWTCREVEFKGGTGVHFDTRTYAHLIWKDPADLCEQLFYRIDATI